MSIRLTARARLALLHTGIVLVSGLTLTFLTYVLVAHSLAHAPRMLVLNGSRADAIPDAKAILAEAHAQTLAQLLTQSAIALTVVLALAAVLSWLVAGSVLRPVRALHTAAHQMAIGELSSENLSQRVPVTRPADELSALAETFNAMLDRIQNGLTERDRLLAAQRMFVANAAHELRTPLTTMRTAIEVTMHGGTNPGEVSAMATDLISAIERSRRTLDGLLALAHSQTGPIRRDPVDLSAVAAAILDRTQHPTVRLHRCLDPAPLRGDSNLLKIMIKNLLDNATRYNRPHGHVRTTTGTENGQVILRISNTGNHHDADSTDRLWEPFVRGRHYSRTDGAGLGLSIVRAVVDAHGGSASADSRPDGGLTVTIALPAGQGHVSAGGSALGH